MSFLTPLALALGVLAGPIILLYMLRLRRREVQVVVDKLNAEIASRYQRGSASVDELLAAERGHSRRPKN